VQSFRNGPAGGVIWLENVQCSGNEVSILECSYDGWGNTSCSHDDDTFITCLGKFPMKIFMHRYCTQFTTKLLS